MPRALERKLKRIERKRRYGRKRTAAYVWGTLRKIGWQPRKRKKK